ncbi:hypothetical protein PR048_006867 [Dryococelus australis]|uniref:DUF659 domain-containing protein n=1 Tax=Dryococelus australis TaxID=614101 RepID=A0ABQ9IC42_9NEOP|nr:hypothetical protein PR048_006867 [Dryococelus australis]
METYIEGSGDLPKAETLRQNYVPEIQAQHSEHTFFVGKKVAVICDEITLRKGVRAPEQQDLAFGSAKILSNAPGTECSRALLDTFIKYEINYNNIVCLVNDRACNMTKCVNSLELSHQNICYTSSVRIINSISFNYINFLKEKYPRNKTKHSRFPSPVLTRRNSCFLAVKYVQEFLQDLVQYCCTLGDFCGSHIFHQFVTISKVIHCQASFLVEHYQQVTSDVVEFESSKKPLSHNLCRKVNHLKNCFELSADGIVGDKT